MKRMLRHGQCIALLCLVTALTGFTAAAGRFALGYLYGGAEALAGTRSALSEAAPVALTVETDGTLTVEKALRPDTVEALHRQGVRVVPLLSNHWDRAAAEAAVSRPEALAAELARAVADYGLDGVQIDLENLTSVHRDAYTELVRQIRQVLPPEKTVAVAIAANPRGLTVGWHGSYDTAALAEYADYLMLMAYDEHYRGSDPGPVASRAFVEASIRQALTQVPPEKLVLGIPLFGRIWQEDGSNLTGQGLGDRQVLALREAYGGIERRDAATGSAAVRLTVRRSQGDSVAGIPLTAGQYIIWYEDESAKKALLSLAHQYGLKGAAGWRLGQEESGLWDYFSLWLNGLPFSDLQGHWSMEAVVAGAERGWFQGVSADSFAPDRVLTRAEAAVLLTRVLELPAADVPAFHDLQGHWAAEGIARAAAAGLAEGVGQGRFAPDDPVSREQLAVLLHRAARLQDMAVQADELIPGRFADGAQVSAYAREAVAWAAAQGLLEGADGCLMPQSSATRAQAAAILSRWQEIPER